MRTTARLPRSPTAQAPWPGKMAAPVDLELKKAFTELQAKVIDTQQKVKLADIQIEQLSRTKKHAHLTDTEIMTLVDETRMYEGVGRIQISSFVLWFALSCCSLVQAVEDNHCQQQSQLKAEEVVPGAECEGSRR
uniref:Prefoldin subunit 1 n=1 Tax=Apteryx owenii TaxID=8824 RepID=A0A8B9PR57_APTOW